jgi:hypothetical protein
MGAQQLHPPPCLPASPSIEIEGRETRRAENQLSWDNILNSSLYPTRPPVGPALPEIGRATVSRHRQPPQLLILPAYPSPRRFKLRCRLPGRNYFLPPSTTPLTADIVAWPLLSTPSPLPSPSSPDQPPAPSPSSPPMNSLPAKETRNQRWSC